ncbi:hypothetical protein GV793_28230 [Nocardia cyriacigeorgica]|nr:hypothetical protein [Nocardia cyriacigeorgica]
MSRIHRVIRHYAAACAVAENGVSIFVVGDSAGAQLNASIHQAFVALGDYRSEAWNDLLDAASKLRWKRLTNPQPNTYQSDHAQLVGKVLRQTKRLRTLVNDESLLDRLAAAATAVNETDSPLGPVLLESIHEVGTSACVVVTSNRSARAGLRAWLDESGVTVLAPSELDDLPVGTEQSYVVAPPVFVPSSLVTAPATCEVTFIVPAWFKNRTVPGAGLGAHAEGRIVLKATEHPVGNSTGSADVALGEPDTDDTYFPEPVWGTCLPTDREPASDEVEARKVLLTGGLALWLDDGDRIRSLDPLQPEGDRVGYAHVTDVVPGAYLVLREGETERGALYEQALRTLGTRAHGILGSQERWKCALQQQLVQMGARRVADELSARGVRSARQVRAWAGPQLICPQRDRDLVILLEWLGEPVHPAYDNAIALRRAVYKASAQLRKELEAVVNQADLRTLRRDGFLHLDLPREGFRGMFVAQVLARCPFTEIVHRTQVRVPFRDESAQWLD